MASAPPEVWLRGPVPGIPAALMPAAHALLQIAEELDRVIPSLSPGDLWNRPGGAASVGFHLRHLAGSLDRLLTYARGESLTELQRAAMEAEERPSSPDEQPAALLRSAHEAINRALEQIRTRASTPCTNLAAWAEPVSRQPCSACCSTLPNTPNGMRARLRRPRKSSRVTPKSSVARSLDLPSASSRPEGLRYGMPKVCTLAAAGIVFSSVPAACLP